MDLLPGVYGHRADRLDVETQRRNAPTIDDWLEILEATDVPPANNSNFLDAIASASRASAKTPVYDRARSLLRHRHTRETPETWRRSHLLDERR